MKSNTKIEQLRELEDLGIVRENCPEPEFWRFDVLKPEALPEEFHEEYERLGEIRW